MEEPTPLLRQFRRKSRIYSDPSFSGDQRPTGVVAHAHNWSNDRQRVIPPAHGIGSDDHLHLPLSHLQRRLEMRDDLPHRDGHHHLFDSGTFKPAFPSLLFASSRLGRAFFSSNDRRRFTLDTIKDGDLHRISFVHPARCRSVCRLAAGIRRQQSPVNGTAAISGQYRSNCGPPPQGSLPFRLCTDRDVGTGNHRQ